MPRPRGGGRRIDFKSWSAIPSLQQNVASNQTVLASGALQFSAPATILRVRGRLQVAMDETKQVGDVIALTFGLGVISSDAFDAGAAGVPDPAGEPPA